MNLSKIAFGTILIVAVATSAIALPDINELRKTKAGHLGECHAFIEFRLDRNQPITPEMNAFLTRENDNLTRLHGAYRRVNQVCQEFTDDEPYVACMNKKLTSEEYAYFIVYGTRRIDSRNDPNYVQTAGLICIDEFYFGGHGRYRK